MPRCGTMLLTTTQETIPMQSLVQATACRHTRGETLLLAKSSRMTTPTETVYLGLMTSASSNMVRPRWFNQIT